MEQTITLGLRAVRHPQTGLAAVLSAVTPTLNGRVGAVYLAPSGPGPAEVLAVGGPEASSLGGPGLVEGRMSDVVRGMVMETAPTSHPTPPGQPEPWSTFPILSRIGTPLPSGAACLLLVGGEEGADPDDLRRASAPIGLLTATLIAEREAETLRRELHDVRQAGALLAAGIQHDLRTPLTSILGSARTLRDQAERLSDLERHELLEIIAGQAERLNHMLSETLTRDAIGPDSPLRVAEVDLREVARRATAAARAGRGGEILIEVEEARIVTDTGRLERAILNLLDNALKYSPPGSPVHLRGERAGEAFCFTVADCGPGVTAEVVPTLFSAYATDPNRSGGVGLGLHSVSHLAGQLGGRVSYARKEGWTRFSLTLPDLRDRHLGVGMRAEVRS